MAEITSGTIPPGIIVDARNNLIAQSANPQDLLRNVNNPSLEATDGSQVASESSDAQEKLRTFWQRQMEEIQQMSNVTEEGFKTQELPLARIKKIMKMDEDVKMISAEAPLLFSKAAQMFITELSLRAWIHTEESKRRTLQRNDIATAITKFDQFDFLIDIVPREEIKPPKRTFGPGASSDGSQFFYSVPQQGNTAANNPTNVTQTAIPTSALQTGQLLIAQQNQNGQPMTLTPFNLDNGQVLQLAQPAAQQQSQSNQQTQQQSASLVLSPSSATVNQNQGVQMQKLSQISAQTNEQKQQTAQALLQDLVNNLPNNQAGVHTIQLNAQGQLQLVKVANPQQSQNATGTERQQLVTDDNQLFGISPGTQQQSDTSVNAIFPE